MNGKSILFGLGLGLILTSALFYFTNNDPMSNELSAPLTDEEVVERARTLGMIMANESQPRDNDDSVKNVDQLTENDIIEMAAEIGMVFPSMNSVEQQQNEEQPVDALENTENVDVGTVEQQNDNEVEIADVEETDAIAASDVDLNDIVRFRVVNGMSARTIAKLLKNNGIIDDSEAFEQFAVNQQVTRLLRAGYYSIRKGTDFDELITILRSPPR